MAMQLWRGTCVGGVKIIKKIHGWFNDVMKKLSIPWKIARARLKEDRSGQAPAPEDPSDSPTNSSDSDKPSA